MLDASGGWSTIPSHPDAVELRAHHHWRTDWTPGRTCLYWYLTFEGAPALGDLVDGLGPAFARLPWLHQVPREWLHLTLREIGYADRVGPEALHTMATAADRAVELLPLQVDLGPVTTMTDAVVLPARPSAGLSALHGALGVGHADTEGYDDEPFWPHVTIGYLAEDGHRDDVVTAFADLATTLSAVPTRLTLAAVDRLPTHYQWRPVVLLGG